MKWKSYLISAISWTAPSFDLTTMCAGTLKPYVPTDLLEFHFRDRGTCYLVFWWDRDSLGNCFKFSATLFHSQKYGQKWYVFSPLFVVTKIEPICDRDFRSIFHKFVSILHFVVVARRLLVVLLNFMCNYSLNFLLFVVLISRMTISIVSGRAKFLGGKQSTDTRRQQQLMTAITIKTKQSKGANFSRIFQNNRSSGIRCNCRSRSWRWWCVKSASKGPGFVEKSGGSLRISATIIRSRWSLAGTTL